MFKFLLAASLFKIAFEGAGKKFFKFKMAY